MMNEVWSSWESAVWLGKTGFSANCVLVLVFMWAISLGVQSPFVNNCTRLGKITFTI